MTSKSNILTPCRLLAALLLVFPAALKAVDYLPYVGPPPLRFAVVPVAHKTSAKSPILSVVQPQKASPATSNAVSQTKSAGPPVSGTNDVTTIAAAPIVNIQAPAASPLTSLSTSTTTVPVPAGNLLTMNPEMLMDYFRPLNRGTNAQSGMLYAPLNLGFVPPVLQNSIQSRATYQVK